jgi:diacylglycerol O-acyltransferase / wax synthase
MSGYDERSGADRHDQIKQAYMERLSGLDAFFLYAETPTQPLNVCCVMELDTSTMPGGYTFDRFRDAMMLRIDAVPEFRLKLADSQLNLGHPVWFDDDDFQLERHLHRVGLPAPGGRHEFAEVCGDIASLPLDRDYPLWEMWVIEDIADGNAQAVLLKAHHAVVDGVAGAYVMAQLCSDKPDAPPPDPVGGAGTADPLATAASGLVGFALRPWRLAAVLPATLTTLLQTLYRARRGRTMAAPFAAPPTQFNASFSRARNVAFTQLDLQDIKKIKNRFGVTVNDVWWRCAPPCSGGSYSTATNCPKPRSWRRCRFRCTTSPIDTDTTRRRGCSAASKRRSATRPTGCSTSPRETPRQRTMSQPWVRPCCRT